MSKADQIALRFIPSVFYFAAVLYSIALRSSCCWLVISLHSFLVRQVGCGLRTVDETAALVRETELAPAGRNGNQAAAPHDDGGGGGADGAASGKLRVPGRSASGPTLPAAGLCLEHVEYDTPWPG